MASARRAIGMSAWNNCLETLAATTVNRSSGTTASHNFSGAASELKASTEQRKLPTSLDEKQAVGFGESLEEQELKQAEQFGRPSAPRRDTCGSGTTETAHAINDLSPDHPWRKQHGGHTVLKRKSTQAQCDDSKSVAGSTVDAVDALRDVFAWLSDAAELLERVLQAAGCTDVCGKSDGSAESASEDGGAMDGEVDESL